MNRLLKALVVVSSLILLLSGIWASAAPPNVVIADQLERVSRLADRLYPPVERNGVANKQGVSQSRA